MLPPPGADGARCGRLVQSTKSKVLAIHPVWVLAYYLYPLLERGATRAAPRAESLRPYLGAESSVLYKVLGTVCRPELPSPQTREKKKEVLQFRLYSISRFFWPAVFGEINMCELLILKLNIFSNPLISV